MKTFSRHKSLKTQIKKGKNWRYFRGTKWRYKGTKWRYLRGTKQRNRGKNGGTEVQNGGIEVQKNKIYTKRKGGNRSKASRHECAGIRDSSLKFLPNLSQLKYPGEKHLKNYNYGGLEQD